MVSSMIVIAVSYHTWMILMVSCMIITALNYQMDDTDGEQYDCNFS